MANEYYYCVSLSIIHPRVDPKSITTSIKTLDPKIEVMAGTERRRKDGTPVIPSRTAALSHWLADLHAEERLYSGTTPISEFILEKLADLETCRDLFAEIRQEGEVALVIGWFSHAGYSAGVLNAAALKKCADLGLNIELNFYGESRDTSNFAENNS
jgi:hypothetical protein